MNRRVIAARPRHAWLFPFSLAVFSIAWAALATKALVGYWTVSPPPRHAASAGLILALAALLNLRLAWIAWRTPSVAVRLSFNPRGLVWRWLFVGIVACYAMTLALGPDPAVGFVFAATVAGWHSVVLMLLVFPTPTFNLANWLKRPLVARIGWGALAVAAIPVAAEGFLRVYTQWTGLDLVASPRSVVRSDVAAPSVVRSTGAAQRKPGAVRIAVVGDRAILDGPAESNCVARLRQRFPGVELGVFGLPDAGLAEYAAELKHRVPAFDPHLVVAFVSVGDDITDEAVTPSAFDWRGLRLGQLAAQLLDRGAAIEPSVLDEDAFLVAAAADLAVCKTPMSDQMHERWELAAARLGAMLERCRRRDVPVALILVPGEFQVSESLRERLCRRTGFGAGELDLELPQRRLSSFAAERGLPVLDLFPHFAAAAGPLYRRDDHAWNDQGQSLAADVVAKFLEQEFGRQLPTFANAASP